MRVYSAKFQLKKLDGIIFVGALLGLTAWYLTGDAAVNIYILTATMLVSIYPIVAKTFKDPMSETKLPWVLTFISAVFLLLNIKSIEPAAWLVQARQFTFAALMFMAVNRKTK